MRTPTHSGKLPFEEETLEVLTRTLPTILYTRRWFGGKARRIRALRIADSIPVPCPSPSLVLLVLVEYDDGGTETYNLPVIIAVGEEAERIRQTIPQAMLAPLTIRHHDGHEIALVYEAAWNRDFTVGLLQAIAGGSRFTGTAGCLAGVPTEAFADIAPSGTTWEPSIMQAEQSNTSVAFNRRVILKLFRRLEPGVSPDFEIGRRLTERRFPYVPPMAGALEYQDNSGSRATLGVLQQFVANDGDAWHHSFRAVERFVDRLTSDQLEERPPDNHLKLLDLASKEYPSSARRLIGNYLESAERLGLRTAQLHLTLSQVADDPAFVPEAFTPEYRQARHDSLMRGLGSTFALLQERSELLPPSCQADARHLIELTPALRRIFDDFGRMDTAVLLLRCHGDYHLGQVLWTGSDFMIIDFEGEPARPLTERRLKHPAMLDVAGLIRSLHYASFAFMKEKGMDRPRWAAFWSRWTSAAFLKGYLQAASGTAFWPQDLRTAHLLLEVHVVEKALYELRYELNNRPDWAEIPLRGLVELVKTRGTIQR